MEILFKFVVYAVSVWVSNRYADGYWVVGPVFGMAVISFDLKSIQGLNLFKHSSFLVASTLIYALVYRISRLNWGSDTDVFNYFIGSFPAAIVTGSILMSVAHTVIFNKSKDVMVRAILGLIASFYFLTFLMYLNEKSNLGWKIQWITVMIAAWQGMYLTIFFSKSKA